MAENPPIDNGQRSKIAELLRHGMAPGTEPFNEALGLGYSDEVKNPAHFGWGERYLYSRFGASAARKELMEERKAAAHFAGLIGPDILKHEMYATDLGITPSAPGNLPQMLAQTRAAATPPDLTLNAMARPQMPNMDFPNLQARENTPQQPLALNNTSITENEAMPGLRQQAAQLQEGGYPFMPTGLESVLAAHPPQSIDEYKLGLANRLQNSPPEYTEYGGPTDLRSIASPQPPVMPQPPNVADYRAPTSAMLGSIPLTSAQERAYTNRKFLPSEALQIFQGLKITEPAAKVLTAHTVGGDLLLIDQQGNVVKRIAGADADRYKHLPAEMVPLLIANNLDPRNAEDMAKGKALFDAEKDRRSRRDAEQKVGTDTQNLIAKSVFGKPLVSDLTQGEAAHVERADADRQARIVGGKTTATIEAQQDAPLDQHAPFWLDQTGKAATSTMTPRSAKKNGYEPVTEHQLNSVGQAKAAIARLKEYDDLIQKLLVKQGDNAALINIFRVYGNAGVISALAKAGDPDARRLEALAGTLAQTVKALGDSGNIAVREQEIAGRAVAGKYDTQESAIAVNAQLKRILVNVVKSRGIPFEAETTATGPGDREFSKMTDEQLRARLKELDAKEKALKP